jgi:dephospho-CoA kinase
MAPDAPVGGPRVLGLTGPIGCGKTTVGDILLARGALERIDADALVHELQAVGTDVTREIAGAFGKDVLGVDGSVDRRKLGRIAFAEPEKLRLLESIVHPAVRELVRERIRSLAGNDGIVVVDAVKLLQSDLLPLVEEVWVVRCSPDVQRERLIRARELSRGESEARIRAQPRFEHPKVRTVIENSGTLEQLHASVESAWVQFTSAK